MVALLEDTAQPEPGSIAELRRDALRLLASELGSGTGHLERALRGEVSPEASPNDTEGPTSKPSTVPSLHQEEVPSSEKSPGLNTTSTDEPTTEPRERISAFSTQWALATVRWAIAAMSNIQRGSSRPSSGLSQLLNESKEALNKARAGLGHVYTVAGLPSGIISTMIHDIQTRYPRLEIQGFLEEARNHAPATMTHISNAVRALDAACEGLDYARTTISNQRATELVDNAAISRTIAAHVTSDAANQVSELTTALSDYESRVEQARTQLDNAANFLASGDARSALEPMQSAAKLAQAANREAAQINLLAFKIESSLQRAQECATNALTDAQAAQRATEAQHNAVGDVLTSVNYVNTHRTRAQESSELTKVASINHHENKCREVQDATAARDTTQRDLKDVSTLLWSTQRLVRNHEASQPRPPNYDNWLLSIETHRESAAGFAQELSNREESLKHAERGLQSAETLMNQSSAVVTALAAAKPSSEAAVAALNSLHHWTATKNTSAVSGANLTSTAVDKLDEFLSQPFANKAALIGMISEQLSRDISKMQNDLMDINEGDNQGNATRWRTAAEAISAAQNLQQLAQELNDSAQCMARGFRCQADNLRERTKETLSDSVFVPIIISLSALTRAFRLADPEGLRPDVITQAQLATSIVADALVIAEWLAHKDRKGPVFAKLLNEHDRDRYQEPDPTRRRKDSMGTKARRFISHWSAQGGGVANVTYGSWNLVQGTCETILGKPVPGSRRMVAGAADFSNGWQQLFANLQTTDGDQSSLNQLKEAVKKSANNYPHWARVGSRLAATAAGAATVVMVAKDQKI